MTDYTPRAGSLPARVIEFFAANPEEELTRLDVAAKFDCQASAVDAGLEAAVNHGALVRRRGEDSTLVWCAGRLPKAVQAPKPRPLLKPHRLKPHIRLRAGRWVCNGYSGTTPMRAYKHWLREGAPV